MRNFLRIFIGIWLGIGAFYLLWIYFANWLFVDRLSVCILAGLLISSMAWATIPALFDIVSRKKITDRIFRVPVVQLLGGVIGLILGLIISVLLKSLVGNIHFWGNYLAVLFLVLFPYGGAVAGYRKSNEIYTLLSPSRLQRERSAKTASKESPASAGDFISVPKIVDTSAIIDGRILDICRAGFLEGQLWVTNFVLDELRHIADSQDYLRRAKGRRGLDILNRLQEEFVDKVIISGIDYESIPEVDSKLVRLAQEKGGAILTTDFNLNRVARLQGVTVLNVNDLSNALKANVLAGEELHVELVKEGKERGQGIAYMDDGTMIIVEEGRDLIGSAVDVIVTSVLQTSTGRLIFAKKKQVAEI